MGWCSRSGPPERRALTRRSARRASRPERQKRHASRTRWSRSSRITRVTRSSSGARNDHAVADQHGRVRRRPAGDSRGAEACRRRVFHGRRADSRTLPSPLPSGGVATFQLATPIALMANDTFGLWSSAPAATCYWFSGAIPAASTLVALTEASPPAPNQTLPQRSFSPISPQLHHGPGGELRPRANRTARRRAQEVQEEALKEGAEEVPEEGEAAARLAASDARDSGFGRDAVVRRGPLLCMESSSG